MMESLLGFWWGYGYAQTEKGGHDYKSSLPRYPEGTEFTEESLMELMLSKPGDLTILKVKYD